MHVETVGGEGPRLLLHDGGLELGVEVVVGSDRSNPLEQVSEGGTVGLNFADPDTGAGEIEATLLEHPGVADVAVTGEPYEDLGERIVAWVVAAHDAARPDERELADHVARLLAPHKRPRVVRFVAELPRNDLGKVQKTRLTG